MKTKTAILILLAASILLFLNDSIFGWLPFELPVVFILIAAIFLDARTLIFSAVILGVLFDGNFMASSGVLLMSLIATALAASFLFNNFFTHRSFYSLFAVGPAGTITFEASRLALSYLLNLIHMGGAPFLPSLSALWLNIFWNTAVIILLFIIIRFLSGRRAAKRSI